eukprot:11650785-Heterocapsa_arctica.AAC.1
MSGNIVLLLRLYSSLSVLVSYGSGLQNRMYTAIRLTPCCWLRSPTGPFLNSVLSSRTSTVHQPLVGS